MIGLSLTRHLSRARERTGGWMRHACRGVDAGRTAPSIISPLFPRAICAAHSSAAAATRVRPHARACATWHLDTRISSVKVHRIFVL
jgi:hypothetical protein